MNVRRFFAPSARDALRRVKEEFGGDAIVLSNRSIDGGVEIMAVPPDALKVPTPTQEALASPSSRADQDPDVRVSLSSSANRPKDRPWQPFEAHKLERPALKVRTERQPADPERDAGTPTQPDRDAGSDRVGVELRQELAAIRQLVEIELGGLAWGALKRESPAKGRVLAELLEAGFSSELAYRLLEQAQADAEEVQIREAVRSALGRELITLNTDTDIIDRGGVYALVGPTGVGKTTTTAKLAARCVVRHGAEKVALLTTDGYRIGAHEQLRIYGRILGVTVQAMRDSADLRQTLAEFRHKHMVLIDTVGMSQRDRQVAEQTAMLLNAGEVRRLLLLSATVRGDTLDDVVRAYSGPDLAGCVVTKVDEAVSLSPVLDVLVRQQLELFYIANGQRVPEDLHLPNRPYLLHRALRVQPEGSPFHVSGDDAGLILAGAGSSSARARAESRRG
jgi:flagellar biosynthesis protein FlhF